MSMERVESRKRKRRRCERVIEMVGKGGESAHAVLLPYTCNPSTCEAEADQEFETLCLNGGGNKSRRRLGHSTCRSRLHVTQHLPASSHLRAQELAC